MKSNISDRLHFFLNRIGKIFLFLIYSFGVAILITEIIFRLLPPMSTGNGNGIGKAWYKKFWHPINQQGYRDIEVKLQPSKKLIIAVGDSFTAGHGVLFNETYTSILRKKFEKNYDLVNLGYNGASTLQEGENFVSFIKYFKKNPDVVIYQYYGNDMHDLAGANDCFKNIGKVRKMLIKISYLYSYFDSLILQKNFNSCYLTKLKEAYLDKSKFIVHKKDIKDLIKLMREKNNKIIFVTFPFLNNDQVLLNSNELYISDLKEEFLDFCKEGDWFYDPSSTALNLNIKDRVVNFMDAHPSELLHEAVANDLGLLILNAKNADSIKGAKRCDNK